MVTTKLVRNSDPFDIGIISLTGFDPIKMVPVTSNKFHVLTVFGSQTISVKIQSEKGFKLRPSLKLACKLINENNLHEYLNGVYQPGIVHDLGQGAIDYYGYTWDFNANFESRCGEDYSDTLKCLQVIQIQDEDEILFVLPIIVGKIPAIIRPSSGFHEYSFSCESLDSVESVNCVFRSKNPFLIDDFRNGRDWHLVPNSDYSGFELRREEIKINICAVSENLRGSHPFILTKTSSAIPNYRLSLVQPKFMSIIASFSKIGPLFTIVSFCETNSEYYLNINNPQYSIRCMWKLVDTITDEKLSAVYVDFKKLMTRSTPGTIILVRLDFYVREQGEDVILAQLLMDLVPSGSYKNTIAPTTFYLIQTFTTFTRSSVVRSCLNHFAIYDKENLPDVSLFCSGRRYTLPAVIPWYGDPHWWNQFIKYV
jgi:hypothetical protein